MKRIIGILFFSALFFASWGYAETITLRADIWCPYNCDPNSDTPGFMVEIAGMVFEKAGHSVDYQLLPWARAITETREGKFNGIIGAYKNDAPDFIFPENEQGQSVDMFYTKKGSSWRYENMASLSGQAIGIIKDYSYGEQMDEYIKKNNEQFVIMYGDDAFDRNLKMLLLGRTTVMIENQYVMNNYMKVHNCRDQFVETGISGSNKVYIAFSPKNPRSEAYSKILSTGINQLRSSGDLQKILDKYGLKDWK